MKKEIKKEEKNILKIIIRSLVRAVIFTVITYFIVGPYNSDVINILQNITKNNVNIFKLCSNIFMIILTIIIIIELAKIAAKQKKK